MKSPQEIKRACDNLRSKYATRDLYYSNNYHAFRGEYNLIAPGYAVDPLTDVRRTPGDHIMVWNLIPPIVNVHRMLLDRLPQINVPSEVDGEEKADQQAEKREKAHYCVWDASKMVKKHGEAAYNLSLFYSTVWFVRWDQEKDMPVIMSRQPGTCYPMFKRQGDEVAYAIFYWQEDADVIWENYPEAKSLLGKENALSASKLEVMEYVDADSYGIVIGDKYKSISEAPVKDTALGFCPVVITPGSFVPDDPFPMGPVHQLVAINDNINRVHTRWGDALQAVMNPSNVLQGEGSDNVVWNPAPGAVNRLPEGVQYVQVPPPNMPTEMFVELERMSQLMQRISGISESAYGESPGSIVTGKAIGKLQGVMTGMATETQACLEMSLSEVNRMCFRMWEKYRPKKTYRLRSTPPGSALAAPGRSKSPFTQEFTPGQDINGWYDNSLYYSPFGSDFGTGLQIAMQLVSADLADPKWVIDQIPGMGDSSGMMKAIEENKRRKMALEIDLQTEAQMKIMQAQNQMQMEQMQQQAQLEGAPGAGGAPTGEPGSVAPEGSPGLQNTLIMPSGSPQAMGTGEPFVGEQSFPLPFQNVSPYAESLEAIKAAQGGGGQPTGQEEAMPGKAMVRLTDVRAALADAINRKGEKATGKLKGNVYALGELATRGQTDGKLEIGYTVKSDVQILNTALRQWTSQNMVIFRFLTSVPSEAKLIAGGASNGVQSAA